MLFDLFDRLLSRAHIQRIRFTFFVYFEPQILCRIRFDKKVNMIFEVE